MGIYSPVILPICHHSCTIIGFFYRYREWRALSREYLEGFYSRFYDIKFDEWASESEQLVEGNRIVDELIQRGMVQQSSSQDAWCMQNEQPGAGAVVRKSDGTSLYLTRQNLYIIAINRYKTMRRSGFRDLGAIYNRQKRFNADEYLYVVEQSQHRHFDQLKATLRAMGDEQLASRIKHIKYGRIVGLSTRSVSDAQQNKDSLLVQEW